MTTFNSNSYQIERPSGVCAATGRVLEPGEAYIAALVEGEEGLKRLDFALEAWEQSQPTDGLLASWRAEVVPPNEKKPIFIDDNVLMNLLRRLAEAEQADRIAFRFVLMLILMRKKLLRYDRTDRRPTETAEDGQPGEAEWWVLTPKLDLSKGPLGKWHPDETIEVMDPHLDDEQIRQVTEQLGEVLNAEL